MRKIERERLLRIVDEFNNYLCELQQYGLNEVKIHKTQEMIEEIKDQLKEKSYEC